MELRTWVLGLLVTSAILLILYIVATWPLLIAGALLMIVVYQLGRMADMILDETIGREPSVATTKRDVDER